MLTKFTDTVTLTFFKVQMHKSHAITSERYYNIHVWSVFTCYQLCSTLHQYAIQKVVRPKKHTRAQTACSLCISCIIHSSVCNNASNIALRTEGRKHIDNGNAMGCTPKEVTWTLMWPEQFFLSRGMSWWENQKLSHLFWNCWVMSSQYHLIMMSSGIRFAMRLVDGASVWFSLVLAWGAMSWKAIRSIKRSTGMAWAAAVCSGLHRDKERDKGSKGERVGQIESTPAWWSHSVEPSSGHRPLNRLKCAFGLNVKFMCEWSESGTVFPLQVCINTAFIHLIW